MAAGRGSGDVEIFKSPRGKVLGHYTPPFYVKQRQPDTYAKAMIGAGKMVEIQESMVPVIFFGIPGVGKTYDSFLAFSVLNNLGFGGLLIKCNVLGHMTVDARVQRLEEMTDYAGSKAVRNMIVIDESDAEFSKRENNSSRFNLPGDTYRPQQWLMDLLDSKKPYLVIMLTNYPTNLEQAVISRDWYWLYRKFPTYDELADVLRSKQIPQHRKLLDFIVTDKLPDFPDMRRIAEAADALKTYYKKLDRDIDQISFDELKDFMINHCGIQVTREEVEQYERENSNQIRQARRNMEFLQHEYYRYSKLPPPKKENRR